MRHLLSFQVEVPDGLDVEAVVQETADHLSDEHGVQVVSQLQGTVDQPFTVAGVVKGKPAEKWTELVHAQDATEAQDKAMKAAPKGVTRTVAVVLPGDQRPMLVDPEQAP